MGFVITSYYEPSVLRNVTGVLSKPGVTVVELRGVSHESPIQPWVSFSPEPAQIGYDWKTFHLRLFRPIMNKE